MVRISVGLERIAEAVTCQAPCPYGEGRLSHATGFGSSRNMVLERVQLAGQRMALQCLTPQQRRKAVSA
jgi:hypothetical protein